MKIHKAGIGTINIATFLVIAINLGAWFIIPVAWGRLLLFAAAIVFWVLIVQFFRYPQRQIVLNENLFLAPADGKVCDIKENVEVEYLKAKCKQISIFMSPLNVHINWVPIPGDVTYMKHKNGEFYAAFKDKSAEENERTTTAIKMQDGREIVVRQIAGAMARRIINYVKEGQSVNQKNELGFIRFGSRVDLFLPLDVDVQVQLGQKVTGSQTVIAKLKA